MYNHVYHQLVDFINNGYEIIFQDETQVFNWGKNVKVWQTKDDPIYLKLGPVR